MDTWLLAALDRNARQWWHNQALRKRGAHEEARRAERRSISSAAEKWRAVIATEGAYVSAGRGGHSVHWKNVTMQGYDRPDTPDGDIVIALRLGLPVIDTTTISDRYIARASYRAPLVAVGHDADDYRSPLSYRPLAEVAAHYRGFGATVHNIPGLGPLPDSPVPVEAAVQESLL